MWYMYGILHHDQLAGCVTYSLLPEQSLSLSCCILRDIYFSCHVSYRYMLHRSAPPSLHAPSSRFPFTSCTLQGKPVTISHDQLLTSIVSSVLRRSSLSGSGAAAKAASSGTAGPAHAAAAAPALAPSPPTSASKGKAPAAEPPEVPPEFKEAAERLWVLSWRDALAATDATPRSIEIATGELTVRAVEERRRRAVAKAFGVTQARAE